MRPWQSLLVVAAVAGFWWVDAAYLDWGVATWLGKQLLRVIDALAIWR